MDFNTCYTAIAGTAKHVGTSFVEPAHAHQAIDMLEMIAGGEAAWRERPFVSCSCCFVVPPMRFAEDACRVLEACVERGMPVRCWRQDRPERQARLRWRALSSRKWPKCWAGWFMST